MANLADYHRRITREREERTVARPMQKSLSQYALDAREGQYLRFASNGRYLGTFDRITDGLGLTFLVLSNGDYRRFHF